MANDRIDRTPNYNLAIFDKTQIGIYFDDFVKYLAGTNNSNMNSLDEILYDFEEQMANVKDGDSAYVHIKWGNSLTPEELLDEPADYIGFCTSNSPNAPTDYTGYKWYYIRGERGEKGNVMYATFSFDPDTGNLIMHTPDEYTGAIFSINEGGEMVVEIEVN